MALCVSAIKHRMVEGVMHVIYTHHWYVSFTRITDACHLHSSLTHVIYTNHVSFTLITCHLHSSLMGITYTHHWCMSFTLVADACHLKTSLMYDTQITLISDACHRHASSDACNWQASLMCVICTYHSCLSFEHNSDTVRFIYKYH